MIVDDNVDAAESLGVLLKALGHEVIVGYAPPARWPEWLVRFRKRLFWTLDCLTCPATNWQAGCGSFLPAGARR